MEMVVTEKKNSRLQYKNINFCLRKSISCTSCCGNGYARIWNRYVFFFKTFPCFNFFL